MLNLGKYEVIASTDGMSNEDWLKVRHAGIGGSDASAALGINRWKTPVQLWLEKTGAVKSPDLSEVEAVHWGTILEDVVASEFSRVTGKEISRQRFIFRSKENPFMIADVDRILVHENAGLECKTASAYKADEWEDDKVPDEYKIQVQHYMHVMGWDRCYIACLVGGQHFVWRCVERDESLISAIVSAERKFWEEYVKEGVAPPVMNADDCKTLWPDVSDEYEFAWVPDGEMFAEYKQVLKDIKDLEERKNWLESYFFERIKDKAGLAGMFKVIVKKASVSWKKLAEAEIPKERIEAIRDKYVGKPSKYLKITGKD